MDSMFESARTLLLGVLSLIIIGVGLLMASQSKKAKNADMAKTGANVFMALVIVALGATVSLIAFGSKLLAALGISV